MTFSLQGHEICWLDQVQVTYAEGHCQYEEVAFRMSLIYFLV